MNYYAGEMVIPKRKSQPLFSIITVTYNAGGKIVNTIESVYKQECIDYEYILVDGASDDDTIDVIVEHKNMFEAKGIEYRYISQNDKGIYDAMNKGVSLADGRWIIFLNAGDMFYDINTLYTISQFVDKQDDIDVVFGDTIEFKHNGMVRYKMAQPLNNILREMPFCHQSSATKKELLLKWQFDLSYKICSDYDFFLGCYQNGCSFKYLQMPLSRYEFGGLSSNEKFEILFLNERLEIQKKHGFVGEDEYQNRLHEIEKYKKYRIFTANVKRFIPKWIMERRRWKLDCRNGWVRD